MITPTKYRVFLNIATIACASLVCTQALAGPQHECSAWKKQIEDSNLQFSLTHSQVPGQLAITKHHLKITGNQYQLDSVSEAKGVLALMFSGQLIQKSEGKIDNKEGFVPLYYAEKRGKKPLTETTVNMEARQITFKKNDTKAPLEQGLQDRLSVIYQISALLRCNPDLKKGDALPVRLMGTGRLSTETFRVLSTTTTLNLNHGQGEHAVQTIELESKPEDAEDDTIRVAFAKQLNWVPVKIQVTDRKGQSVTQTLVGLKPTSL
jgi:hypothetical protein